MTCAVLTALSCLTLVMSLPFAGASVWRWCGSGAKAGRERAWLRSAVAAGLVSGLAITPVLAEEGGKSLAFSAKAGDAFVVTVNVVEKRSKGGAVESQVERRSSYDGQILAASPQGYRIRLTLKDFSNTVVTDTTSRQARVVAAVETVSSALKGMPVEFNADRNGALLSVETWDTTKAKIASAMQPALEQVLAKAMTGQGQKAVGEIIAAKAKERAAALVAQTVTAHTAETAVTLFQYPSLPARIQGRTLNIGQPALSGSDVFGADGDTAPVKQSSMMLDRVDAAAGAAHIAWSTTFDEAALKAKALAGLKAQLQRALATVDSETIRADVQRKFDRQLETTKIVRSDSGTAQIALADGWARQLRHVSRTQVEQDGLPAESREKVVTIQVDAAK